jgi:hypothetical protein
MLLPTEVRTRLAGWVLAGPAAAIRPYEHVVSRLDGVSATTTAFVHERTRDLYRFQAVSLFVGDEASLNFLFRDIEAVGRKHSVLARVVGSRS